MNTFLQTKISQKNSWDSEKFFLHVAYVLLGKDRQLIKINKEYTMSVGDTCDGEKQSTRKALAGKVMLELKLERGEGAKHRDKWEKNVLGKQKNKHKGTEVGECLTHSNRSSG